MLVLARQSGESLIIGDNIEIKIVEVQGNKVKIGIDAPKQISILRKELVEEAKNANKLAASPNVDITSLSNICLKK